MKFDDIARRAAEQSHRMAARVGDPSAVAYRERRVRRTRVLAGAAVASVLVTAVAVLVLTRPPDDIAAVSTTIPDTTVPTTDVTSTTLPGDGSGAPVPILGAGWEELDAGPIAGRHGVAAVWTGTEIFAWGGHPFTGHGEPGDYSVYHQNGFLYDPATATWRPLEALPDDVCSPLGRPRAIAAGDVIILKGAGVVIDGCATAAAYHLATGTWEPLRSEFFSRVASLDTVAWTGELLVAPRPQLAYDWATRQTIELPALPAGADDAVHSPQQAHWTGDRVLSVGSGSLRSWVPGTDDWTLLDGPPVPDRARDSIWTDEGLLVVNYQMAAAFFRGARWTRQGDLPLRFSECLPEAVAVGGTAVVRMCSGLAIWDDARRSWVPVPLEDVAGFSGGRLVAADDALYSVGPALLRFDIRRDRLGVVEVPPTVPIGIMQLDVPDGFGLSLAFAPEQGPEGYIKDEETIHLTFEAAGGRHCSVTSTYGDTAGSGSSGMVMVDRPGRPPLQAFEGMGVEGGSGFRILAGTSDVVAVFCENPPPNSDQALARADALAFVAGLWSPWEEPMAEFEAYVTEGSCGIENMPEGWQDDAIRYGPLWLWHVAPPGQGGSGADPSTKTIAVLDPGAPVTITIAPPYAHRAAHLYNSDLWNSGGAYRVDRHERSVTFLPCEDEPAQFVGGFVFTGDPCVEVDVTIGSAPSYRAALPFSSAPCSESIWTQSPSDCPASAPFLTGSAGALPFRGDTAPERVADFLAGDFDVLRYLLNEYFIRGVDARSVERRGEVWYWDDPDTASYAIERAVDLQIEVLLDADEPCPEAGASWNRIPIVFNRAWVAHEVAEGHRVEVPAGWTLADESLTPYLERPREIFSAGTYPLRPGGDWCAQFPVYALEDLGATDAFVSVQRGGQADQPRPEAFTFGWFHPPGVDTETPLCLSRPDRFDLFLVGGSFREDGRSYLVLVAIGDDATEGTRAQVLHILNSLEYIG